MTGNQWQYVVVFVLLIAIVVWICYNLLSKKRRHRMSQCPGCSMNNVCHKEFRPREQDGRKSCCQKDPGSDAPCGCGKDKGQG